MRTKILILLMLAITVSLSAQNLNVPRIVKDAFVKLYPNVKSVKWSMEDKTEYEAEFMNNKQNTSVNFDKNGKLMETEIDINKAELPSSAVTYVAKNYLGWSISEISKVIDGNSKTTFEVQVKKGKSRKDLVFDNSGNFIKNEK
jgi:hypothetical protein